MAEDKSIKAGEYVLGTLSAAERAVFERQLRRDPDLAVAVEVWERRLGPLAAEVEPVDPPADLWARIEAATASPIPPRAAVREKGESLLDRVAFWRWTSLAAGAAAAGLAVALAIAIIPRGGSPEGRFVAALQSGGEAPPVVVTVDLARDSLAVRSLAATAPAERSYEVWYIGEGESPRSLGVLDEVGAVITASLSGIAGFRAEGAVFAITDEPEGGSPTGGPTGPIVYSGPLVQQSL
ncbi:MAG: anti-sigma factor [Bauldia sp.]|nr:anti-sigma factor [Bauldia sp.]